MEYLNVHIRKPVWKDRSISIRKNLITQAQNSGKKILVTIGAKPFNAYKYLIDPKTILLMGKPWIIKGLQLLNFPIALMQISDK